MSKLNESKKQLDRVENFLSALRSASEELTIAENQYEQAQNALAPQMSEKELLQYVTSLRAAMEEHDKAVKKVKESATHMDQMLGILDNAELLGEEITKEEE